CAHHAPFDAAEMAGVRMAISIAMAAQNIGNLDDGSVRTKVGTSDGPRLNVPLPGRRYLKRKAIERALRRPDRMGGNLGVARRRRQIVMPEQDLDDTDIGSVLQKVRREAVAQRVQRDPLGQTRSFDCRPAGGMQHCWINRMILITTGEE